MRAPDGEARIFESPLFFHSGNMLAVFMPAMTVQRGTNPQEKFKGVTKIVAVVAVEAVGSIVDRELGAEPNVHAVSVRQIAHVTDGVSANGENGGFISGMAQTQGVVFLM